jgi:hypothetical protein
VGVLDLALKELLGETALDIDSLVVTMLFGDVRENLSKPGGCEECRKQLGIVLDIIWQP